MREIPGCTGKRLLPSKQVARKVLAKMKTRGHSAPGDRLNVYHCECGFWHVGHSTADERMVIRGRRRALATD